MVSIYKFYCTSSPVQVTIAPSEQKLKLETIMTDSAFTETVTEALTEFARRLQNDAGSCTGDGSYDAGYETGSQSAGYNLEELLRSLGLWQEA